MFKKVFVITTVIFCFISFSMAQELSPIKLLPPDMKSGKSLMQSLKERKTAREFSTKKQAADTILNQFAGRQR